MTLPPAAPDRDSATGIAIGSSVFSRLAAVVMALPVAALVTLSVLLFRQPGPSARAAAVVFAVLALVFAYGWILRPVCSGVRTRGDRLVVRGAVSTRHLRRDEIRDVQVAPTGAARIRVGLADGRWVLAPVTTRWPHGAAARTHAAGQVRVLRAWAGLPV